jgi:hypothetical protein
MADFLTSDELSLVQGDFASLIADPEVCAEITYQTLTGRGTFDRSTQQRIPTFSNCLISAFRAPIEEGTEGNAQIGDYRYLISIEDVEAPKKDDRIIDGDSTRFVVATRSTPIPLFHSVLVRDVGVLS